MEERGLKMPMDVIIMDQIVIWEPLIHIMKAFWIAPMKGFCASRMAYCKRSLGRTRQHERVKTEPTPPQQKIK